MRQIIIVKPGSIPLENKQLLQDQKVIIIEHDNPSEVRVVQLLDGLEGDDVMTAMRDAINDFPDNEILVDFATNLLARMKAKEIARKG